MDRGAWWATVHGVAKSQKDLATKQQHNPLPPALPHLKPGPSEFVTFLKVRKSQWQWWDPGWSWAPPPPLLGGPPAPLHNLPWGALRGAAGC